MRLFIAVFPPSQIQRTVHAAVAPLRAPGDGVSWVQPENLHFTMRFLGEADDTQRSRAVEAMRTAASAHTRFGAAIGGFGAFPTAKRARVLWLGLLQGAEGMRLLSESLEQALARAGFDPPEDSFEPHLTVGRVRTEADWTARLIEATTPEARFQVDRMVLVSSTLAKGGSVYEPLAEAPMG